MLTLSRMFAAAVLALATGTAAAHVTVRVHAGPPERYHHQRYAPVPVYDYYQPVIVERGWQERREWRERREWERRQAWRRHHWRHHRHHHHRHHHHH